MNRLRKRVWPLVSLFMLSLPLLAATSASATPPVLYHSPGDDGVSGGVPAYVGVGAGVTLHLYLGVGATASTADPCFQGDGDELCGHRLRLTGSGVEFQTFTPADPDLIFKVDLDEFLLTGGDFQTGELGPTRLGDLVIDALSVGGSVDLTLGEFVTTQLAKETTATPTTIVTVPEPTGTLPLALGAGLLVLLHRHRIERRPSLHADRSPR